MPPRHRQAKTSSTPPDGQHPTTRRQRPNIIHPASSPPGRHNPTARRLLQTVATATDLELYRLTARPAPLGIIPVAHCYWFLALFTDLKASRFQYQFHTLILVINTYTINSCPTQKFIMFPYFPKTRHDHATLGHSDIINGSIFHTLITSYI